MDFISKEAMNEHYFRRAVQNAEDRARQIEKIFCNPDGSYEVVFSDGYRLKNQNFKIVPM